MGGIATALTSKCRQIEPQKRGVRYCYLATPKSASKKPYYTSIFSPLFVYIYTFCF